MSRIRKELLVSDRLSAAYRLSNVGDAAESIAARFLIQHFPE